MALPDEDRQHQQGYRYSNGRLKADFEIIRSLANNRGAEWTDRATGSRSKVVGTTLDADSFSGIDSCKEFGSVYATAKQIYEDTLKGVEQDVKDYQQKLLQVATHLEEKDNRAGEVFAGLAAPRAAEHLHSSQRNTEANTTQEARDAEKVQEQARKDALAGSDQGPGRSDGPGATAPPATGTDNVMGAPPATDDGDTAVQASR